MLKCENTTCPVLCVCVCVCVCVLLVLLILADLGCSLSFFCPSIMYWLMVWVTCSGRWISSPANPENDELGGASILWMWHVALSLFLSPCLLHSSIFIGLSFACLLLLSSLLFSLLSLHFYLLPATFLCLTLLAVVFTPSLLPPLLPMSFPPFWFLLPSLHLLSLPAFIGFTLLCCFLRFLSFPPYCTALNYSLFFSFLSRSSFFHLCQPFFLFAFLYFSSLFYNNQHCPCEGGAHYLYLLRLPVVSLTLTPPHLISGALFCHWPLTFDLWCPCLERHIK